MPKWFSIVLLVLLLLFISTTVYFAVKARVAAAQPAVLQVQSPVANPYLDSSTTPIKNGSFEEPAPYCRDCGSKPGVLKFAARKAWNQCQNENAENGC